CGPPPHRLRLSPPRLAGSSDHIAGTPPGGRGTLALIQDGSFGNPLATTRTRRSTTGAGGSSGGKPDPRHVRKVLDSLRRIVRSFRVSARAVEGRLGISAAQLFVLHQLAESDASSIDELAARTLTHQSSVSVVVARLAERGLVVRRTARDDARRTEIALS